MDEKQKQLKKWIDESDNIVFFGGAGVSTESGIPAAKTVFFMPSMNMACVLR